MSDKEKRGFRQRLDTILFRLDKRLYDAMESQYVACSLWGMDTSKPMV